MTAAEDVAQPNSRNLMGLVIVDGCNVRTKTHVLRGVAVKRRENLWVERQETHKPLIWEHIPWRGRLPSVSVEHMSDTVSVPFSLSLELSP